MTDKEIIKALECCSTGETYADCEKNGCPLYLGITMGCKYIDKENQLYSDALDLINCQQADNERLKKLLEEADVNYNKCAKRFYKEGVKELAELLHCHCENRINNPINQKIQPLTWAAAYEEFEDVVDNLVKEMVGDTG